MSDEELIGDPRLPDGVIGNPWLTEMSECRRSPKRWPQLVCERPHGHDGEHRCSEYTWPKAAPVSGVAARAKGDGDE